MAARTNTEESAPAPEAKDSDLGTCANCDQPATVKTDGKVANAVAFCDAHRPDNLPAE